MPIHYNFDKVLDRQKSDCDKWTKFEQDVLPMWVADMDFISPEPVIRALRERANHGIFGYPGSLTGIQDGLCDIRTTIVERLYRLYHWKIELEHIVMLPGVIIGFNLACHAFCNEHEAVMVQTPVYPPILHAAQNTGVAGQEMDLSRQSGGNYSIDWDQFESIINKQTKLFILCNPHNPIGKVFTHDELLHIGETCLRKGVIICSDEIHSDLVFPGNQHIPIASLDPELAQSCITLMAPSKTYNLAGLQCSYAIIPNGELRLRYLKARKGLVPWVNLMGILAANSAYQEGQEWLDQLLIYLETNRDFVTRFVAENLDGIKMSIPQATYLAWLDCHQAGIQGSPAEFFLKHGRLALNAGESFGKGGEGFVRLNFGCPHRLLEDGLNRIRQALTKS